MAEESFSLLDRIHSPEDLKKIPEKDLDKLAKEIRTFLVERVSENGGHLASNLGVVELTIALHRVFSTPKDHIIFDVGHQCYVHKLLTGRREEFDTLRCAGGLSGFPKRDESEHDAFGTGHASTSLSAALGFAEADKLSGSDAYTVCVLGDGAYTGGMIHEALNNCKKRLRLIIILNENEMSINKNLGRFAKSLSHLRATHGYIRTKNFFRKAIGITPDYTLGDKIIAYSTFIWSFGVAFLLFFVGTIIWNTFSPWPIEGWGWRLFIISVVVACGKALISMVWFMIGGIVDLRQLFRDLKARTQVNDLDNGMVDGHVSLADKKAFTALEQNDSGKPEK